MPERGARWRFGELPAQVQRGLSIAVASLPAQGRLVSGTPAHLWCRRLQPGVRLGQAPVERAWFDAARRFPTCAYRETLAGQRGAFIGTGEEDDGLAGRNPPHQGIEGLMQRIAVVGCRPGGRFRPVTQLLQRRETLQAPEPDVTVFLADLPLDTGPGEERQPAQHPRNDFLRLCPSALGERQRENHDGLIGVTVGLSPLQAVADALG